MTPPIKRPKKKDGIPTAGTRLCRLDELGDPGAKGFLFGPGPGPNADTDRFDMFVIRRGQKIFAYVNACPHALTPLDTFPDRFLTLDATRIICSTHGALFRLEDGFCTSGPCVNKQLIPVPVTLADGEVRIA